VYGEATDRHGRDHAGDTDRSDHPADAKTAAADGGRRRPVRLGRKRGVHGALLELGRMLPRRG
jgi:hypothetical protein